MRHMIQSFEALSAEQLSAAGGKGGSLVRLFQAGFPVPDGFVILPSAFADDLLTSEAWEQIEAHLARMRSAKRAIAFAVRSSAQSEDSAQASFAGEFETVLNVSTDEEIRQAIHKVYRSRKSERVRAYSQVKGMSSAHEIAIVVQELVHAERSGVLFTANPVAGQRDQVMISAAWGLGEAIVGGLVTPDTLTLDKETGRILSRETADKQVMTVRLVSGTVEQPVPDTKRRVAVLSDGEAAELAQIGTQIELLYGMPMDIEWTLAEGEFAIVQARPITALPEAEPPTPVEWKLPKGKYMAMRNNIVELMADPLTPLFATWGRSSINDCMDRWMSYFLGSSDIMPEEPIVTVNSFAYYNGSLKPGQIGLILLRSVGIMKRMFTEPVARWIDEGRPKYIAAVEDWQAKPWRELPNIEILDGARQLFEAAIDAYLSLVSGVIPAAWISEALFTFAYGKLIKRRQDPSAPTYLLGYDSTPIQADKSLYDLAEWANGHDDLAAYLKHTPAQQLAAQLQNGETPASVETVQWREWQDRFQAHLKRYGHTIYNLDFANPVPADDPIPLLETCKMYLQGQGVNPHARQHAAAERREQATQTMLNKLSGLRLRLFRKLIAPAQRFAPLREDALAEVGLSYPLLRAMLLELGGRFTEAGMIEEADDIFWLEQDEVEKACLSIDGGETLRDLTATIPLRRGTWRSAMRATPPLILPQIKLFGLDIGKLKASRSKGRGGEVLKGVAASPGSVTAPASVLHGVEDFAHMETGSVLVAAITTPAWTPLFARAAAVVTDVGGPLSHGSIVAREYGIPAVLGTGAATKRIQSGQVITVDGSAGTVTISANDRSAA